MTCDLVNPYHERKYQKRVEKNGNNFIKTERWKNRDMSRARGEEASPHQSGMTRKRGEENEIVKYGGTKGSRSNCNTEKTFIFFPAKIKKVTVS